MFRVVRYAQNPALSFHHPSPQVHLNTTTERETFEGNQSDGLKSSAVKRDCKESTLFIQTWVDFLKVEQDRNAILILGHQIISRIHHILLVVWSQDTAQTQHWDSIKSIPNNKEHMEENHSRTSVSVRIIVAVHLKESMFRTRGARGMSMNNEFVKKAIRRRASRFSGTSMADSRSVNKRWSLLICSIPWKTKCQSAVITDDLNGIYNITKWHHIQRDHPNSILAQSRPLSVVVETELRVSLPWLKTAPPFLVLGQVHHDSIPIHPYQTQKPLQSITSCSLQIPKPHACCSVMGRITVPAITELTYYLMDSVIISRVTTSYISWSFKTARSRAASTPSSSVFSCQIAQHSTLEGKMILQAWMPCQPLGCNETFPIQAFCRNDSSCCCNTQTHITSTETISFPKKSFPRICRKKHTRSSKSSINLTLKTGSSFNLKLSRSVSFSIFISTSFRRPSITLIWVVIHNTQVIWVLRQVT